MRASTALIISHLKMSARRFLDSSSAATVVEYGLIVSLIAVFLVVSMQTLGGNLNARFQYWVDFFAAH
jgi:Flp pilus assembly pilin Flp